MNEDVDLVSIDDEGKVKPVSKEEIEGNDINGQDFKRIMIFGRPGSGKSTFAHNLAKKTGLPLHHLDKHFFVSGWVERDTDEFMHFQEQITKKDSWIIDGNSTRSLEMRWSRADLVLYFNYAKVCCLIRLIKRLFTKPVFIDDRAHDCPEVLRINLIKYMWTFEERVKDTLDVLQSKYKTTKFFPVYSDDDLEQVEAMIEHQ